METYFARLVWNRDGWRLPSGQIARGEHGTYVGRRDFGHEEWLNRSEWIVDGWRYGYVEGVGRSPRLCGKKINIILFAIKPSKERVFVGKVTSAEVLTEAEAKRGHTAFRHSGWIKEMIAELEERLGRAPWFRRDISKPGTFANIRFRPSAMKMLSSPVSIPVGHVLQTFSRYKLMAARPADERQYRDTTKRSAMKGLKAVQPHARRAVEATVIDPVEARMQNELRQLLEAEHGKHAVQAEKDFIDIQVTIGARNVLIEMKSAVEARRAIRQRLGQLVDYAYFGRPSANSELVIVGRGRIQGQESRFIATLTKRFQLPIRYIQYVPGNRRFKL